MGCDDFEPFDTDWQINISIHAPACGATLWFCGECRHRVISIHAPAWGATRMFLAPNNRYPNFNPRTRMGCDWTVRLALVPRIEFQSTHPHGVRPGSKRDGLCAVSFQSTHPHGVRPRLLQPGRLALAISIHAPVWGATPFGEALIRVHQFQSTHPHGVRRNRRCLDPPGAGISIHAPAWGATFHQRIRKGWTEISIHAPAWGATQSTDVIFPSSKISIHAPAWGATISGREFD